MEVDLTKIEGLSDKTIKLLKENDIDKIEVSTLTKGNLVEIKIAEGQIDKIMKAVEKIEEEAEEVPVLDLTDENKYLVNAFLKTVELKSMTNEEVEKAFDEFKKEGGESE